MDDRIWKTIERLERRIIAVEESLSIKSDGSPGHLLPCPFCGCPARHPSRDGHEIVNQLLCSNYPKCWMSVEGHSMHLSQWNRRANAAEGSKACDDGKAIAAIKKATGG